MCPAREIAGSGGVKRLTEKCPEVRRVPAKRGRYSLELDGEIELAEMERS